MDDFVALGVDPASTKVAFVALSGDQHIVSVYPRLGKSGGPACAAAWHITNTVLFNIHTEFPGLPIYAFIESPVVGRGGVRSTMVQCFTSGAIQGALHEAGCRTQVANVSTWKKHTVGKGNATKDDVRAFIRLRWPAIYRVANGNQDIYDAACIALYGQQLLRNRVD